VTSWREFGAIRILSPLRPEVVIDNVRRADHDVIVPEELKEFGVTDFGATVNGSQFEINWIVEQGVASPRCRGVVRASENGSRIVVRSSATPIDSLLILYLPLATIAGMAVGRSPLFWLAFTGVSLVMLFFSRRNRGAEPMRARLIQLISIVAKAPDQVTRRADDSRSP